MAITATKTFILARMVCLAILFGTPTAASSARHTKDALQHPTHTGYNRGRDQQHATKHPPQHTVHTEHVRGHAQAHVHATKHPPQHDVHARTQERAQEQEHTQARKFGRGGGGKEDAGTYVEIVSTRAATSDASASVTPPWWPRLPPGSPISAAATSAGALILIEQNQNDKWQNKSGATGALWLSADGNKFSPVKLHPALKTNGRSDAVLPAESLVVTHNDKAVAIVNRAGIYWTECSLDAAEPFCTMEQPIPMPMVSAIAKDIAVSDNGFLWIGTSIGMYTIKLNERDGIRMIVKGDVSAVSWNSNGNYVIAGGPAKIWTVDCSTQKVVRWDWVSQVSVQEGWGGVIDDAITDIDVGANGTVYIGNDVCLNTYKVHSIFSRIGPDQGLPVGNISSVAVAKGWKDTEQVWLGTVFGAEMWMPEVKADDGAWRYFAGPRWLTSGHVKSITHLTDAGAMRRHAHGHDLCGDTIVIVTEGGVTFLHQECWTLAQKAQWYEDILNARHDRHGLTSDTTLPAFGQLTNTTNHDDDNNGLWTSLIVVAEYMRFATTGDEEALKTASKFFKGLVELNEVTGKTGLMARSCCNASEARHGCGVGTWIHDNEQWHNSTAPGYKGWTWKGDTSSDETTGHMFALIVVASISPISDERAMARKLLTEIVGEMIKNGYLLIDVTGNATTWGRWSPMYVNDYRPFSDERGLQSLQMLAYIASAANVSTEDEPWNGAYNDLINSTNQYTLNMLNLKIQAPFDDNYSDDELTFLPFFTYLFACASHESCRFDRKPTVDALIRTFEVVRPERSSLWGAITLGMLGGQGLITDEDRIIEDITWNLQTWPLELIHWPINNTPRMDIIYDLAENRFGASHQQSWKNRSPIPANERLQPRWNGNPWDVVQSDTGMVEVDPGAWLLPYWMSRYFKLLST